MNWRVVQRIAVIVMALFPAMWGLLGFLNDATDFTGTANEAVRPMIDMANTYGNPRQTWRAIAAPWAASAGLVGIMTAELVAGVLATIGLVLMLRHLTGSRADFARGKAWMVLGALVGVLVWGVGFMVIAGDWFLAWQAKVDPLATQIGGMIYMVPCALAVIVAMLHREAT